MDEEAENRAAKIEADLLEYLREGDMLKDPRARDNYTVFFIVCMLRRLVEGMDDIRYMMMKDRDIHDPLDDKKHAVSSDA